MSSRQVYPTKKSTRTWRKKIYEETILYGSYTMYEEEGTEAEDSKPWNFQQNHSLGYGDEFELKK